MLLSPWPSLVTVAALIVYFVVTINVGRARAKYKIMPPAMSGNPDFERVVRVHQNTLEQLIAFLPALWIFSVFVSPIWAAAIGGLWVLGRIIYAWGYYQAAEKRGIGFAISSLTNMILLIGSLVGIILNVTQSGILS
ncbi:MAPEG family protein [Oscillatoria acuminata]|uniref:Putative MAPEG superfamily protein related to glutathione S-transferase n=1 Tax=Oscillatoria acuminata PCC 6304 TaxID=56110 RepID=K9TE82_9CYAN|nr:MAPEG family protein [Oscillatoria acuminata]AFY80456.1 putative MAPEG superfamily protein related to glutathione S-transferase [Oscillatoria acuminata PCC 6304]